MKINRFIGVLSFVFVCSIGAIIEDKDVTSVLSVHTLQRRANAGGICTPYIDHNYYLYEGEVALIPAQGNPLFPADTQYAACLYNDTIVRVYEAKTFSFDGNRNLGPYNAPNTYAGVIVEGVTPGKTIVEFKVNGTASISFSINIVVLSRNDDYLEKMDKQAFFTAISQDELINFKALIERGVSLSLTNENGETVIEALAKSVHEDIVRYLAKYLYSIQDHSHMIELITSLIKEQNNWCAAIVLQYFPFESLQQLDTEGNFQIYAKTYAINEALENKDYTTVLNLLKQGYPVTSTLDNKGTNPLLSALMEGEIDIALKCIEHFSASDLSIANKDGLSPLMIVLQQWKSDKNRGKYKEITETLLAKMNHKDFSHKDLKGKTIWDYASESTDPDIVLLVKKYVHDKLDLSAQEIVNYIQTFAPSGVWNEDLINQVAQFMTTVKDLGARDAQGNTALMLALQQQREKVAKILAKHVPFPVLVTVNRKNQSALQMAQVTNHRGIVNVINERIAKEEKDYFYEGLEGTCSSCMYIPTLNRREGILSVASCVTGNKNEKSNTQEVLIKSMSYVYNGRGQVTVLNRKMEGVFYTARPLNEFFGADTLKEMVQQGYKHKFSYTTATAAMKLSESELSTIDPQGIIKKYIQKSGYFAAAVNHDLELVTALINRKYDPNVVNAYAQNPVMAAFQHKSIEIAKKLFPLIEVSKYGQRNYMGKTLLMYAIEARQKDMATKLLNGMKPEDLIKSDKKKATTYELLLTAGWNDLLEVLRKKAGHLSLFYTDSNQFSYVPNAQGTGGSYIFYNNRMSGLITVPNQVICPPELGTVIINKSVAGVPWNTWAAQNGINLSALKSYSTMSPVSVMTQAPASQPSMNNTPISGLFTFGNNDNWF